MSQALSILNASLYKSKLVKAYFPNQPTTVKDALLVRSWLYAQTVAAKVTKRRLSSIQGFLRGLSDEVCAGVRDREPNGSLYQRIYVYVSQHYPKVLIALYRDTANMTGKLVRHFVRVQKQLDDEMEAFLAWESLPSLREYLTAIAMSKVTGITDSTFKSLQKILEAAVKSGNIDIDEVIKDIQKSTGFSKARAARIARTEIHAAMVKSQLETARKFYPPGTKKQWLSAHDDRVRRTHEKADKQERSMDTAFDVGGEELQFPGDPNGSPGNIINCRCGLVFNLPENLISEILAELSR